MKKTIAFHTFGCKLNFAETSTISRSLSADEYKVVDFKDTADIYVIHSCTVTALAEKKCRQMIRSIHRNQPNASIVVMGCYAQLRPEELEDIPGVKLVLGNTEKYHLSEYLDKEKNKPSQREAMPIRFEPSYSLTDRTRSFLKIQDGCDYYCSYCTIPFARGHSRSASIDSIVKATKDIKAHGIKEMVLTGVNIGDFGKNTDDDFLKLITVLDQESQVERIRISSIEPDLLSDDIIRFVASSKHFLPHFHIPLQSGSDRVLKSMKRRYDTRLFSSRVKLIKEVMPDACIAADVITGVPGETDQDFEEMYKYLDSLKISYLHVFTYSDRPGTLASKNPNKTSAEKKKERSRILHALSLEKINAFYMENRYKNHNVLFETDPHKDYLYGFTDNYIRVKTQYNKALINTIRNVYLDKRDEEGNYIL